MNQPVLSEFSRRAMATEFSVMLPGMIGQAADSALSALAQVEAIENQLSIYVTGSDVSRLNHAAGTGPVVVSSLTLDVLDRAITLSRLTNGAFDITAGPLVEAWGFTKRRGQKPSSEVVQAALARVGYQKLVLDHERGTAELLEPGMAVNLGAIGKGYALDHIAASLRAAGIDDFLVHGGRSSVLVAGDDEPGTGSGWRVAVEHPLLPGTRLGGLRLGGQALGTSGSGKQFFHHQGRRLGHVIDPRTGWPSGDMLSLTVLAPSAMDADALATGLFVMGWEQANQLVQASKAESTSATRSPALLGSNVALIGVFPTGRQAGVELRRTGLAEGTWIELTD
jgi:thiamine biosynthesis lipoprotein